MILSRVALDDLVLMDCAEGVEAPVGLLEANLGSGPEPRVSSEVKPSADGTINRTRYWGPRLIELVGYCADVSRAETTARLDEVRAAFSLREAHTLRFTPVGQAEHEVAVVVASRLDAPVSGWATTLEWAITLEAADPRLYLAAWVEVSYEPSGGSGVVTFGLDFRLDFALNFSTPSEAGADATSLSAWNGGTTETPVEFILAGPVVALRGIRNRTTGEEIAFGLIGLGPTDELRVETGARTVYLNGEPAPALIDAASTDWFLLAVGENVIDIDGEGFTPGDTRLTARYREAKL